MDNETRQYGSPERGPRKQRPKQYFPEESYREPAYEASYRAGYEAGYEREYREPEYAYEPAYREPAYREPEYAPQPQGSNAGTIALGVLAAGSFVAAVSLFFLWRGAAAEADKPPVVETEVITTTETETKTETTTKFPSIFGERDEPTATLPDDEPAPPPAPEAPEIPPEVRDEAREIIDQLRDGAGSWF
ncbi:hypothetical protein [Corynebacterium sp. Marseille-P4321]|uniref:hypothetical protein n=1 Tax=Corynebacterium sp. Marseille-P4321 TaxID=2736603 RepID=UPI00158968E9|nr:hypothetical protein [Corynebacterium sp. Marseille-P4321]